MSFTKVFPLLVESGCLSRDVTDPLVLVSASRRKQAGCLGKVSGGFHVTQSGEGNLPAFGKSARSVEDIALLILGPGKKSVRLGQFACAYRFPRLGFQCIGLRIVAGQHRLRSMQCFKAVCDLSKLDDQEFERNIVLRKNVQRGEDLAFIELQLFPK